jgi:hypothetical protein
MSERPLKGITTIEARSDSDSGIGLWCSHFGYFCKWLVTCVSHIILYKPFFCNSNV